MVSGEKETIFATQMKYVGIFSFKDYYQFCYDWLTDEVELAIIEKKYKEKLIGDAKDIEVKWEGEKEFTDYFKFLMKVTFRIYGLKDVEITRGSVKEKMNKGEVKVKVEGILWRDYDGKFERTYWRKFLRGLYEKWVILSRIKQFEDKIVEKSDEFLQQAKAFLDLEGKR